MSSDLVVASGIRASYGEGALRTVVLNDASFKIQRGGVTAVIGPSGSGKTTLLSLLGGLDTVDGGRLCVDGIDLNTLSRSELGCYRRERVGFVFQFFNLLPTLDALENVEAALDPLPIPRRERRRRAERALEEVGLTEKRRRFPHELSGGEQQRVAVARAQAKEPSLLLADEPTGNLDAERGEIVLDLLLGRRKGSAPRTVVIVTHDASVASRTDRLLRIDSRQVVEG